jgi:SP family sugar:H+ symporter-like MFS transporter
MMYIGVNQAVHPPTGKLDGNSIFAIVCVYLFVVFYSFGKSLVRFPTFYANISQAGDPRPLS